MNIVKKELEALTAAIKKKDEEAILNGCIGLAASFSINMERIADAAERIAKKKAI